MVEGIKLTGDFRQTDAGIIPVGWDVKPLYEVAHFENGKAHEQFIDEQGDYVVVNSKFISTEGKKKKYSKKNIFPLKKGAVTIVMSDIPNGKALAKCFLIDADNKYTLNQRIGSITANEDTDNKFLFYKLNRNKYYLAFDSGTGQTNIRRQEILDCPVALPPTKGEQSAIATALIDMDSLLKRTGKMLEKKRNIKKGVMQELLRPKGSWIEKELGVFGDFKNGINKSGGDFGFGYPFVNLMDVFGKTNISSNQHLDLINSNEAERKLYDLRKDDVLFIRSSVKPSGVGLTCVIKKDLEDTVFSGFIIRYRENGKLTTDFKEYCFYSNDFRNRLIASSTVSANTNINQEALKSLKLSYPESKTEQDKIAQTLIDMDAEIELLETQLSKYKMLRTGIMQNLLTGKKRLV